MPPSEPAVWMWAEACEMLERAERLHRQFFQPAPRSGRQPSWLPPIDVYETPGEFWILVALPGVEPGEIEVVVEQEALVVAGVRRVPAAVIHRLEIPHGRFERRIDLPGRRLRLCRRELLNGCLLLCLEKE